MSKKGLRQSGFKFKQPPLPVIIAAAVLLVLGGISATYAFYYTDRYLPRTVVAGIAIGGLKRPDAEAKLNRAIEAFLTRTVQLQSGEKQWDFIPQEYGTSFAVVPALDEVWGWQKTGGWRRQLSALAQAPVISTRAELGFIPLNPEGQEKLAKEVLTQIEQPYREVGLEFSRQGVKVIPGEAGQRLDTNQFEQDLYNGLRYGKQQIELVLIDFQPELTVEQALDAQKQAQSILASDWTLKLGSSSQKLSIDQLIGWLSTATIKDATGRVIGLDLSLNESKISANLDEWAGSLDRLPLNARLAVVNDQVVAVDGGRAGNQINKPATLVAIGAALLSTPIPSSRNIVGVVEVVEPAVSAQTLSTLGLTQLIGTGTTDYSGSPVNRKGNISVGQQKLNGTLLPAGATYSTIEQLGPIDEAAGFLVELVIKDNRTLPEAGGGLCQVSTTLFRAVLNAGMPIVERQNHSYRVSYYEREVGPGLDATIYDPKPDFRWRNDLSSAIYVQSYLKSDKLTFELYGTGDGRVSTIGQPVIYDEIPPGNPIYIPSDTLNEGEQRQIEKPHGGAKTSVSYQVTRNGETIISQTFKSVYKAWPAQYLVGTKPNPAPEPTPTPESTPQP